MFDRETWRFINTFAPWLSAVGSLAAVVVSLYLARRNTRLDLRVFPALARVGIPGQKNTWENFFQIRVVNHGGRDAVVNGVGWWWRGFPRRNWLHLPPDNVYSAQVPKKLAFGEEACVLYPLATFNRDAAPLLKHIAAAWFPEVSVRLIRVGVFTSTGQQFRVPLDAHLRQFFLERSKQVGEPANVPAGSPGGPDN